MLAIGLQQYGLEKEASRLKLASERMIQASGFWEYFDPRDGAGCGGSDFSWTAAVALFWFLQEE
jgi:hypothetical protein